MGHVGHVGYIDGIFNGDTTNICLGSWKKVDDLGHTAEGSKNLATGRVTG